VSLEEKSSPLVVLCQVSLISALRHLAWWAMICQLLAKDCSQNSSSWDSGMKAVAKEFLKDA
jgi:hypothetical protein